MRGQRWRWTRKKPKTLLTIPQCTTQPAQQRTRVPRIPPFAQRLGNTHLCKCKPKRLTLSSHPASLKSSSHQRDKTPPPEDFFFHGFKHGGWLAPVRSHAEMHITTGRQEWRAKNFGNPCISRCLKHMPFTRGPSTWVGIKLCLPPSTH